MKIGCDVVKDLLPLYHDGVCSVESKELIEEHLTQCENCSRELSGMETELPITQEELHWAEAESMIQISKKWKKGMFKSLLKGVISTALIFVLIVAVSFLILDIKIVTIP